MTPPPPPPAEPPRSLGSIPRYSPDPSDSVGASRGMEAIIDQPAIGGAPAERCCRSPRAVRGRDGPEPGPRKEPCRLADSIGSRRALPRHDTHRLGGRQEGIMESELEPKTSSVLRLHKIGGIGNFTATMIAGTGVRGGVNQSNLKAICDRLRLKYRLKD